MVLSRRRSVLVCAVLGFLAACDTGPEGDPFAPSGGVDESGEALTFDCGAYALCSGSGAATGATFRVGVTSTSRGDLLQLFKVGADGLTAGVNLTLSRLRTFTSPSEVLLHAEVFAITNAAHPEIDTLTPVASGALDLAGPGAFGNVTIPMTSALLTAGTQYGLAIWTDELPSGSTGSLLIGVGTLQTSSVTFQGAGYAVFRRGVRRTGTSGAFGLVRFRPGGAEDLAFALDLLPPGPSFVATGGTETSAGGYRIHTFTSSGTFTVTTGARDVEVLVIGAGGGGGGYIGGGGGGGGVVTSAAYAVAAGTPVTVTVGDGGPPGTGSQPGASGTSSSFGTLSALGGGGGGGGEGQHALPGGSGGGGGRAGRFSQAGTGFAGQGHNGGVGSSGACQDGLGAGAGGGGYGAVGGAASGCTAGTGAVGYTTSFSGTSQTYAGGGGGGAYNGTGGAGGAGGGGAGGGGQAGSVPQNGTPNTGGGGGAGGHPQNTTGGLGGSGVVIVRYPEP